MGRGAGLPGEPGHSDSGGAGPGTDGAPKAEALRARGRENGPAPRTLTPTGAGPLLFRVGEPWLSPRMNKKD